MPGAPDILLDGKDARPFLVIGAWAVADPEFTALLPKNETRTDLQEMVAVILPYPI